MCLIFSRNFSTKSADLPNAAFDSADAISNSCLNSCSLWASLIPLPPPPNADFNIMGYFASAAIFTASSTSSTTSSLPGTVGTSAFFMISLHFILSPVNSIARLFGPINMRLFFSHSSTNFSFSDRNPYPG